MSSFRPWGLFPCSWRSAHHIPDVLRIQHSPFPRSLRREIFRGPLLLKLLFGAASLGASSLQVSGRGDVGSPLQSQQGFTDLFFWPGFSCFELELHVTVALSSKPGAVRGGEAAPTQPSAELRPHLSLLQLGPNIEKCSGWLFPPLAAEVGQDKICCRLWSWVSIGVPHAACWVSSQKHFGKPAAARCPIKGCHSTPSPPSLSCSACCIYGA